MKLTQAMKIAGIVEILHQNGCGSYTSQVLLECINLKCNKSNPRPFDQKHSNQIFANFYRPAVRNPILRYSDAMLSTIEGRHTTDVLIRKGFTTWTCDIHFDLSAEHSARVFHDLTTNAKRIGAWQAHLSGLLSQLPKALAIQTALDDWGFKTPADHGYTEKTADLTSYTPLKEALGEGPFVLDTLLAMVCNLYTYDPGGVEQTAKGCEFQRGLIDLITDERLRGWNADDFVAALWKYEAIEIQQIANVEAAKEYRRSPTRTQYHNVMFGICQTPRRMRRNAA